MKHKTFSIRVLRLLLAVTGVILALHLLLQYLNLEVFYQQNGLAYELSNRLDMDDESSLPTWFAQALFLAIGAGALLAAYLEKHKPSRFIWLFIAIIGLAFSVDEVATLHEFALQTVHVVFYGDDPASSSTTAWWLIAPAIPAGFGWILWKMTRVLSRRTVLLFMASGVVFLTGAVAFDSFTSFAARETFLNQGVFVAAEETLELLGSVVALYATASYLEIRHLAVLRDAFGRLKPKTRGA